MRIDKDQAGFVSLFTCIMISMLLLIITISLISLEGLQLRKAVDAEQSLRAYYAAEAGIEDAVSKVLSKSISKGVGDNVCNKNTTYDVAGQAGWTCQQISFSGSPTGKTEKADLAKTIDAGDGFGSVIIEWGQSTAAGGYNMPGAFSSTGFPTAAGYSTGGFNAPPIELALIEYPNAPVVATDVCKTTGAPASPTCKIKLQNLVIAPNGATAAYTANYGLASFSTNGPFRGNCGALNRTLPAALGGGILSYNCYAVIGGLTSSNFMFRLRSKYVTTPYKMVFRTGSGGDGNDVLVPDGTATIDVTANAGQTYRRVISKLPLNNSAAAGLNYVIYSDTNVCKNFDVLNNTAITPYPCT